MWDDESIALPTPLKARAQMKNQNDPLLRN
jgi:hypothetical protein